MSSNCIGSIEVSRMFVTHGQAFIPKPQKEINSRVAQATSCLPIKTLTNKKASKRSHPKVKPLKKQFLLLSTLLVGAAAFSSAAFFEFYRRNSGLVDQCPNPNHISQKPSLNEKYRSILQGASHDGVYYGLDPIKEERNVLQNAFCRDAIQRIINQRPITDHPASDKVDATFIDGTRQTASSASDASAPFCETTAFKQYWSDLEKAREEYSSQREQALQKRYLAVASYVADDISENEYFSRMDAADKERQLAHENYLIQKEKAQKVREHACTP